MHTVGYLDSWSHECMSWTDRHGSCLCNLNQTHSHDMVTQDLASLQDKTDPEALPSTNVIDTKVVAGGYHGVDSAILAACSSCTGIVACRRGTSCTSGSVRCDNQSRMIPVCTAQVYNAHVYRTALLMYLRPKVQSCHEAVVVDQQCQQIQLLCALQSSHTCQGATVTFNTHSVKVGSCM